MKPTEQLRGLAGGALWRGVAVCRRRLFHPRARAGFTTRPGFDDRHRAGTGFQGQKFRW